MATTVLIVEHVLSGIQFAFVFALACILVLGAPDQIPVLDSNWLIPVTILGLAIVYPIGVLVDEFADLVSSGREKTIRETVFANNGLPTSVHLIDLLVHHDSSFLDSYFGYLRMRIRIARSAGLNFLLLTIVVVIASVFQREILPVALQSTMRFALCAIVLGFCLMSVVMWRSLVYTFAKRIAHIAANSSLYADGHLAKGVERQAFKQSHWPLLSKATAMAIDLHANQPRKGSDAPYLCHLYGVTSLVLEQGGADNVAAAAMLHDAAEDQGGQVILNQVGNDVDKRVAELVLACSDTLEDPKPPWRERKERAIASLSNADRETCLIKAADVLHNLQSCIDDYARIGNDLWQNFKGGRDGLIWYFGEVTNAIRNRAPDDLVRRIDTALTQLKQSSEGVHHDS